MRKHRTTALSIIAISCAAAATGAAVVLPSTQPGAAAANPVASHTNLAGRTAAQVSSRLVIATLSDSAHATPSSTPTFSPVGVTIALASLNLPGPAALPSLVAPPAVVPVAPVVPPAAVSGAPAAGVWAELRQCESSGDYSTNTGNGYYGAYQFSAATWHGIGYSGLPSDAAPAVQDQAAQQLQARSGWGQWPACSRKLGLR